MFYRDCSSHINRRSTYCWINLNNLQWKFRLRLHLSCQFNKPAALAKYPRAAAGFAKNLAPLWRTSEAAGYYVAKCWSLNNSRGCQCDRFGYAINYFFPLNLSGGHYKYDVYPVGNRFCVAASEEKRSPSLHLRPLSFPFASPRHWPDLGVPLFAPHLVSACLIKGAFDESPLRKNRNFA